MRDKLTTLDTSELTIVSSIHSNTELEIIKFRSIFTFLQKLSKIDPDIDITLKNAEWGFFEGSKNLDIRFFSPLTTNQTIKEKHNSVIQTIQDAFNVKLNLFVTTRIWKKHDPSQAIAETPEAIDNKTLQGPQQSIYSLEEIKNTWPEGNSIVDGVDASLAYYTDYSDTRNFILKQEKPFSSSVIFMYMAILHRDQEMIEFLTPYFNKTLNETILDEEVKHTVLKNCLHSLCESKIINNLINKHIEENKIDYVAVNNNWSKFAQSSKLFSQLLPYMSFSEKTLYKTPLLNKHLQTLLKPKH